MITIDEYKFLTDQWDGPFGAAYNQVYEFCKDFRWMTGFDKDGTPVLTDLGKREIANWEKGPEVMDEEVLGG